MDPSGRSSDLWFFPSCCKSRNVSRFLWIISIPSIVATAPYHLIWSADLLRRQCAKTKILNNVCPNADPWGVVGWPWLNARCPPKLFNHTISAVQSSDYIMKGLWVGIRIARDRSPVTITGGIGFWRKMYQCSTSCGLKSSENKMTCLGTDSRCLPYFRSASDLHA